MQTFEKLYMWDEAKKLYAYVHGVFVKKKNTDSFFQHEILRSIFLIGGTMAQGHEINLAGVNDYLREAKGFAGVCKNTAYVGMEIGYFSQEEWNEIIGRCSKIAAWIYKYMTSSSKKSKE